MFASSPSPNHRRKEPAMTTHENTRLIPLTQGQLALVDFDDFEKLKGRRWSANKDKGGCFYAVEHKKIKGKKIMNQMHREIVGAKSNEIVDHINHNTLDNRKENLRACSVSENHMNRKKLSGSTSRFKGVYFKKSISKFVARIYKNYKTTELGCYKSEIDAAKAYDAKAIELFGEFALTNKMLGLY